MALSWCKVASNLDSHPKIRKAGRLGREVFLFALRRNAEPGNPVPGRITKDELDPAYLADLLQMPVTEAVTGVTAAVTAGLLTADGNSYVIVGWDSDWGRGGGDGAARTAKWRANKKLSTAGDKCDVTNVTRDASDIEERRGEEKRVGEKSAEKQPRTRRPKAPETTLPTDWNPRPEDCDKARALGLDSSRETERFRDHHTAKGTRYVNWDAAFRTWIGKSAQWAEERNGVPQLRVIPEL